MTPDIDTKRLTIGTAGHVDHGKTTLIKAMTGINTDRLKEEQERGLTIDLGFAHMRLPSGREVGIVDVPGHERFLKNMLAGASGVDVALLVVAADEGPMPQTREHLEILQLLETKLGVVALSKCDMVDAEWIDIVEEELRNELKDTFLGDAKIIRVSGETGEGVPELITEIDRLADLAEQRATHGPFRLPIDRAFTITGFGTVVTGTLASGTMKLGDPAVLLPQGMQTRIRNLEVAGQKSDVVYAGSRVAVNLAGVELSDVERGNVIVPPGYLEGSATLDIFVQVLKNAPRPLKNRTRVRVHIGTDEAIGWTAPLGTDEIPPGGKGLVQLRLEKNVVAARGDRLVLRYYSPMHLLGGGIVLDPVARRHRRNDPAIIQRLERTLAGDPADIVEDAVASSESGLTLKDLAKQTELPQADVSAAIEELLSQKRIVESQGRYFQRKVLDLIITRGKTALQDYHKAYPMRSGMPKEELRAQMAARLDQKGFQAILGIMEREGEIVVNEATVRLTSHEPRFDQKQQRELEMIESEYAAGGVNPPLPGDIEQRFGAESKEILTHLLDKGTLVKVTPEIYFHSKVLESTEKALRDYLAKHSQITVSEFRDLIGSSRKYVVPLLEYFDAKRVTRRVGDHRILAK